MCPLQPLLIHKRWRSRRTKTFRRHFSIVADSCSIINYDKSWWCYLCFRNSLPGFPPDKAMQFQDVLYLLWMYSLPKIHQRRAWGSRGWSMRPSTVNFRVYWSTTWHNFSSQNLDMISIVTKLPTWLFSVRFVLDLIVIITTTLHDWCFPSLRLLSFACYYLLTLHSLVVVATVLLHYIFNPRLPEYQFVVGLIIRKSIQRKVLLSNFENQEQQRPILS